MTARVLAVFGTSSSAGKSLLVTALCRIYARQGLRVAPFKAQNMSNNAAVCPDGAEIGRAQAVQAAAAGIEPTADVNPVLLKPEADARSQIVLMGRAWLTASAQSYYQRKRELWSAVTAALGRLRETYELVIIEGAGSPVELNLKTRDFVNMAMARYAQAPVLLVGDIDRGGVFAQLLGTLWLLEPEERALVRGLVVNKFRGDPALFVDGVRILEERGGVPVLGIVPYLHDLGIPEEDAVALDGPLARLPRGDGVDIAVIRLPRIANFDDFDPLAAEPGVRVRYVSSVRDLGRPQAVVLPGTKSTIADLAWLRAQGACPEPAEGACPELAEGACPEPAEGACPEPAEGLAQAIQQLAEEGTAVVGICGGYQMLGQVIRDPDHVESSVEEVPGLGLLPVETVFKGEKATHRVQARVTGGPGWLTALDDQTVQGYEIHMGRTRGGQAWIEISERSGEPVSVADGAVSSDGRVWGCYLHGLFENEGLRRAWLSALGWQGDGAQVTSLARHEAAFDRLADAVETALDMDRLEAMIWGG